MRRFLAIAAVALTVLALPACQMAKVGGRCSASQGAARNATHVLFCVNGRWKASLTIGQAAQFIVNSWPGSAVSSIGNEISMTTSVAMPEFDLTVTTRGGNPAANTELTLGIVRPGEVRVTRLTPTYRTNANGVVHVGVPGPLQLGSARNGVYTLQWFGPHPDPILVQRVSVAGKPASVALVSGGNQSITAGESFAPFRFQVRDALGLAVPAAGVRVDDAGYLGGTTVTESGGIYSVTAPPQYSADTRSFNFYVTEPAPTIGGYRNIAYVNVAYTVKPAALADARVDGDEQVAPINTRYSYDIGITPTDEFDNMIYNVPVTFTAIPGITGASATLTPYGGMTASFAQVVANGIAGEFEVRADITGLGSYFFTLENTP